MADYAELITALKAELGIEDAAVIGFGGSYGASYLNIQDGAVLYKAPGSGCEDGVICSIKQSDHAPCAVSCTVRVSAAWECLHVSWLARMIANVHAGGMLASWMRLKYPHILDGAIAGSAPIWSYLGEHPVRSPSALAPSAQGGSACPDRPCCVPVTFGSLSLLSRGINVWKYSI